MNIALKRVAKSFRFSSILSFLGVLMLGVGIGFSACLKSLEVANHLARNVGSLQAKENPALKPNQMTLSLITSEDISKGGSVFLFRKKQNQRKSIKSVVRFEELASKRVGQSQSLTMHSRKLPVKQCIMAPC